MKSKQEQIKWGSEQKAKKQNEKSDVRSLRELEDGRSDPPRPEGGGCRQGKAVMIS